MTRKKAGLVSLFMLALFCGFEIYHQTGIVHATRKNGYGCLCHGYDPVDSVRVWISGPDSLRAGERAIYSLNVAKRATIAAGFNVAAYRGSLGIVDSVWTQLLTESPGIDSLELTHTWPRPGNGRDTISWEFLYTAPPMVGFIDTLYAVGNSVNLDTLPDGDAWNYSPNFTVRVVPPTSVADGGRLAAFRLAQNYPNPFNPSTTISWHMAESRHVTLRVFDVVGNEVALLVNERKAPGLHTVRFDGSNLSSGIYLYQLKVGDIVLAKKMMLIR